jgi:hypothetical protein
VDKNNLKTSLVVLYVSKVEGVQGGNLVLPQLGIEIDCSQDSLIIFDGKALKHFVTDFDAATEEDSWNRASMVFVTSHYTKTAFKHSFGKKCKFAREISKA